MSCIGAIELSLHCANVWDTDAQGLTWWSAGCPENDPRVAAFRLRESCYQRVIDTLEASDNALDTAASKGGNGTRSITAILVPI